MGTTEREPRACANKLRQEYGGDARLEAAKRCTAMLKAGDHAGYATWEKIFDYIDLFDYVTAWKRRTTDSRSMQCRSTCGPVDDLAIDEAHLDYVFRKC